MAAGSPPNTAVIINLALNINSGQDGYNLFSILNRIRMNCRRILLPQLLGNTGTDLQNSLKTIYNTTLNIERALFAIGVNENNPSPSQLRSCFEMLRSMMPSFIDQMSQDSSSTVKISDVLHIVFLVICDLHLVEAMKVIVIKFNHCYDGSPISANDLPQTLEEPLRESVQKRYDQLVTKAQITMPTRKSICKVALNDTKQLVDETFTPLTNKLSSESRNQLAGIIAIDECLFTELKKLKDQPPKLKGISSNQLHANRSKLRYLIDQIDSEINQFIQEHFAGERPLLNPRPSNNTSFDLLSQLKDDRLANSGTENDESSSYSMAAQDDALYEEPDPFDLSDIMEPSGEPDSNYTDPQSSLIQAIDRLCNENGIKDAVWSLSTENPNLIVVNGNGITDDRRVKLEQDMSAKFPEFQTKFINAELTTQDLTGMVLRNTCKNKRSQSPQWETCETATCEILLTGQQPHRKHRKVVYAVTSAHLLLNKRETEDMQDVASPQQEKMEINRGEVNKRIGEHIFLLEPSSANGTNTLPVNLCNPALLSYRYYDQANPTLQATATDTRSSYMTDIALLPIEIGYPEHIMQDWMQTTKMSLLTKIQPFTASSLQRFIENSSKVYANNGRQGKASPRILRDTNESRPRALHLPFILTEGEPFKPGDSGSLIYARIGGDDNKRVAIGLLKGVRHTPQCSVYHAIVLKPAIEEIENDYRHLVKSLELYTPTASIPDLDLEKFINNFASSLKF